ncbi:MAG TPA: phosphatase PAP2 family protein [Terriglobales bacterium]|nr:phosphatase PAP2 family protein [Terriglobales bacterium]
MPHASTRPETPLQQARPALGLLLLGSLAVSVLALLFFSWLARGVFEGAFTNFDLHIRSTVHGYANPTLTLAMEALSDVGSPVFLSALFVVLVAIFLFVRWRYAAIWLATAMAGAVGLDVTLKDLFHRARPVAFFIPEPGSYSFPSGHALGSFCFYMVLAGLLTARMRNLPARILIWAFAALLVGAIGFSRVYLGVHWPTDVIAGYAAAAFWVAGLVTGDRYRRRLSRISR